MKDDPQAKLTSEQKKLIETKGRRLAKLLYLSAMPEKIKLSWIEIVPLLNLDQINKLCQILENEQTESREYFQENVEEENFREEVAKIEAKYWAKTSSLYAEAKANLDKIEAEINKLEAV